jgi:hypothetical protein
VRNQFLSPATIIKAPIDSNQEFLNHFSIDKDKFYAWGISTTIFPDINEISNA